MKTIFTLSFISLLGFMPVIGEAQFITISGYITDFLTGGPIENATIFEKSSGIGTISDKDGFYKLTLSPGQKNIIFANNGFETFTQKFTVSADTTLVVQLKPEKWAKKQEKLESSLNSAMRGNKISGRKKFLFF